MSAEVMPTRAQWDSLGEKMAQAHYASFTATIVIAGIQLFMNFYGLSIFLQSSKQGRKGRLVYVIAGFTVSIIFFLGVAVDMYSNFVTVWNTVDASGYEYLRTASRTEAAWSRVFSLECIFISLALSDAILLYRCYILWRERVWVLILPGLGLLASLVAGIIYAGRFFTWNTNHRNMLAAVATFTLRAVNVAITFLLTYKILLSRRSISSAFSKQHLRRYDRIMTMLIEAAVVPAVLGIVDAVHSALPPEAFRKDENLNFSYIAFSTMYSIAAVAAPQIIIFRVTVGRSFVHSTEVRHGEDSVSDLGSVQLDHSIRFAQHTTELNSESGVDSEGQDQSLEKTKSAEKAV